jgi:hypothetical protein
LFGAFERLLVFSEHSSRSAAPIGFESYKKNAAAGGVMGMIEQIINDAKAMPTVLKIYFTAMDW